MSQMLREENASERNCSTVQRKKKKRKGEREEGKMINAYVKYNPLI